jgi:hypothetical protein
MQIERDTAAVLLDRRPVWPDGLELQRAGILAGLEAFGLAGFCVAKQHDSLLGCLGDAGEFELRRGGRREPKPAGWACAWRRKGAVR